MTAKIKIVFGSDKGNPYDAAYTEKMVSSKKGGSKDEESMDEVSETVSEKKEKPKKSPKDRLNEGINRILSKKSEGY